MNRQRGFIALPMMAWGAIAAGVVIAALTLAVYVQTQRLDAVKAEYGEFKAGVEALGKAAEVAAKAKEAADKSRKEKADEENKRTTVTLRAELGRLRNLRSASRFVPESAPGAASPAIASFDRAELESAIGKFVTDVQRIADEGGQAVIDLETAKAWARP